MFKWIASVLASVVMTLMLLLLNGIGGDINQIERHLWKINGDLKTTRLQVSLHEKRLDALQKKGSYQE